ncbi:MAG: hypothetical protein KFB96_06045 [Thiocapsa sp.]|uniref:hypothetical protein n=1 Tax=Thiocapsa sp. TaxID=2024551 RepID=UPI001BCED526|nr:hypothetical protein [Thiocapsa sp.]QVL50030.1 MAG: hypothetical protein KFB96_06045 [Thiocapsa sp.]
MSSTRQRVIGGWGPGVLLIASLAAIGPAAGDGVGLDLLVVGDPYSPVPEPFATFQGSTNLGEGFIFANQPTMIAMGGLTANDNEFVVTPQCTNTGDPDHNQPKLLTQIEFLGALGYQYKIGAVKGKLCDGAASGLSTLTLTVNMNANSCLVSGRAGQLEAGSYPVTKDVPNPEDFLYLAEFINNGVDPIGGLKAYRAIKGGTSGVFSASDVDATVDNWQMSVYLPATRPCKPPTGPSFLGTTPGKTNTGRIGYGSVSDFGSSVMRQVQADAGTTSVALGSGGAGLYQQRQKMDARDPSSGIVGAKRIQALPLDAGVGGSSPYGGYRTDGFFVQCGANNGTTAVTLSVKCRLAGVISPPSDMVGSDTAATYGVRVQVGGVTAPDGFNRWTPTGAVGQTVKFRAREVSWVGYGDLSDETSLQILDDGT